MVTTEQRTDKLLRVPQPKQPPARDRWSDDTDRGDGTGEGKRPGDSPASGQEDDDGYEEEDVVKLYSDLRKPEAKAHRNLRSSIEK